MRQPRSDHHIFPTRGEGLRVRLAAQIQRFEAAHREYKQSGSATALARRERAHRHIRRLRHTMLRLGVI